MIEIVAGTALVLNVILGIWVMRIRARQKELERSSYYLAEAAKLAGVAGAQISEAIEKLNIEFTEFQAAMAEFAITVTGFMDNIRKIQNSTSAIDTYPKGNKGKLN
jgi:hypothetical protein